MVYRYTTPYFICSYCLRLLVAIRSSQGACQWFTSIGGLGRPRVRVLEPQQVGWGGGTLGY